MGHNHSEGESSTISFRGFHEDTERNPSGGIICGYDLVMSNHNQIQALDSQNHVTESNYRSLVNRTPKPNTTNNTIIKNKETKTTKKVPTNNFPSNVKSLLSTGIFDGIHVKYVSWSREELDICVLVMTAISQRTKHPNNHIYFENGKTIYAVVQELKNTPQDMLFDAIQNVTGSTINQKNFSVWKASYQAATRELQRIYGKDEVVIPS
ncbi:hypothetical protein Lal_00017732 [Lupinus albus]|nr:hypothetical protein Lal_00017732 [Lupinus albus]